MNTQVAVHPKLHHYGLVTTNLDPMIDWYGRVLGMTLNHRSTRPAAANGPPFSAMAFMSNDEADHRVVFFEIPAGHGNAVPRGRSPLQHVAFQCDTIDELLGTYLRLKNLGIQPLWTADHGVGIAMYFDDPDRNVVEISVNNYGNPWTATEHIRTEPTSMVQVDPDKMVAARRAGASLWTLHERAVAGELSPAETFNPRARFGTSTRE